MGTHQERRVARRARADDRDQVADERDRVADERDHIADERDRVADERDRVADEREDRANAREEQADERELRLDAREQHLSGHGGVPAPPPAERLIRDSQEAIGRGRDLALRSIARLDRSAAQLARGDRRDEREQAEIDHEVAASSRSIED
jgi:hypothetical protein